MKNGTSNMWLSVSAGTTAPVGSSWLEESLMVFEGEMTCCALKHNFGGVDIPRERTRDTREPAEVDLSLAPLPYPRPPTLVRAGCDRQSLVRPILGEPLS